MSLPLAGQVALVTGASRGIGASTAMALATRGAPVVLTARRAGRLAEPADPIRATGGAATLLPLDLAEGEAVDRLGPSLFERFRRLDILVGNAAALGRLAPVPHIATADWDATVAVNLGAGFRLIRTCAPLLLAAPAGRAVFVTSGVVPQPAAYWGLYGATKAALHHLVLSWAAEVSTSALRVNLFDPGVVATRLRAQAMPGEDPRSLRRPADVAAALADLCGPEVTRHGAVVTAPG